jgi:hypothetical protein
VDQPRNSKSPIVEQAYSNLAILSASGILAERPIAEAEKVAGAGARSL